MGEDKSGKSKENEPRKVLGDVTNQLGKRGYSLISKSPTKSKNRDKQSVNDDDNDVNFWKQVALVVNKFDKDKGNVAKCPKIGNDVGLSPLKGGKIYRLQKPLIDAKKGVLSVGCERKEVGGGSGLDSVVVDGGNGGGETAKWGSVLGVNVGGETAKGGDVVGESLKGDGGEIAKGGGVVGVNVGESLKGDGGEIAKGDGVLGVNVGESSKGDGVLGVNVGESLKRDGSDDGEGGKESQGDETVVISDVAEDDGSVEVLGTQVVSDGGMSKSLGVDCVVASNSDSIVSSRLGESQDYQGFGLKRCALLKGDDEGSNEAADFESIKHCSCSFCTKAAFIWSDLHYQDMKGRLSVLAKSRKEASNLAQKYDAESEMGKLVQGNNVDQLEIDLTKQWKSLFFHMEDTYSNEGSQLQNDFLALKEIRDDYKMNLETTGMTVDALQSSSDASDHTS